MRVLQVGDRRGISHTFTDSKDTTYIHSPGCDNKGDHTDMECLEIYESIVNGPLRHIAIFYAPTYLKISFR